MRLENFYHNIKDGCKKDIGDIKFNQQNIASFLKIRYSEGAIAKYNRSKLKKIL
jgi:uncharacterized protein YabN with tetrapyrrole methylase and pyrophosphatase domain